MFVFVLLFIAPASVNAGFFDILSQIFKGSIEVSAEEAPSNVQTMSLLQAAINQDPNPAKGGGDITIVGDSALLSEGGPSGTIANVEDGQGTDNISVYVVRSGDSLSGIAKIFGVSVNTIIWANDIKGGKINPGQSLIILPISGVQHRVVRGDTLASLAKKYNADLSEIAQFNGLSLDSAIAIGDTVIIPDGVVSAPVSKSTGVRKSVRGASGPSYEGYYLRPVLGGRKSQGLHGYNGVDLAAPNGSPLLAAAGGKVIISKNYGWNGGYGNYIVVSHPNGTQTLYAHLSKNLVFEGYSVVRGQVIGNVGSTGKSTGSHVHFEIRGAKNPF